MLNQAEPHMECITRGSDNPQTELHCVICESVCVCVGEGNVNEIKMIVTKFEGGSE